MPTRQTMHPLFRARSDPSNREICDLCREIMQDGECPTPGCDYTRASIAAELAAREPDDPQEEEEEA